MTQDDWHVEKVLDDRLLKGERQYLIRWTDSWISAKDAENCKDKIIHYYQQKEEEKMKEDMGGNTAGVSVKQTGVVRRGRSLSYFAEIKNDTVGIGRSKSKVRFNVDRSPSPERRGDPSVSGRGRKAARDKPQQPKKNAPAPKPKDVTRKKK